MRKEYYKELSRLLLAGGSVVQATVVSGEHSGIKASAQKAFWADGEITASDESLSGYWPAVFEKAGAGALPRLTELDGFELLLERLTSRQKLVICGGGHIALPLANLGSMLDFDVTVIDDREEFANPARFPIVKSIVCEPFDSALDKISYTDNTYFVIITRGHRDDRLCLEKILRERFAYVGMIGSRRKVGIVMEQMEKEGYSRELLNQVYAPIGLKIGAQTPAEIAVCIAAQMIEVRSGASDGSIPPAALDALAKGVPMVLATILQKEGSAPRGVGAKLLADSDGNLYGTVGGGAGEASVIAAAPEVLRGRRPRVMEYSMTNKDATQAGMVCGGVIRVLLDPISGDSFR
ncbi:MAG: xanthine dehydrogenase [Ruminococcaceae bacterium]|nr:xanthine dehydrogenase [Oscillospiraceae bacterium]